MSSPFFCLKKKCNVFISKYDCFPDNVCVMHSTLLRLDFSILSSLPVALKKLMNSSSFEGGKNALS